MGKILLYYKYVAIEYPERVRKWQHKLCTKLGMTGRILIGHEGINGTVGGSDEACQEYKKALLNYPLFKDIDIKESEGGSEHFPKLRVAVRDEIVHLGLNPHDVSPQGGGKHLSPDEVHELLKNKTDDLVVLDGRNYYEAKIGTFKDAITPKIENFREFPEYVDQNLDTFKDKEVLMFCTGGIRCERATTYLKSKGVTKQVYQIEGGIHRYIEKYPDGFFRGKNYVFDGRVAVKANDDIIGRCDVCTIPNDDYTNCLNTKCNAQYLACTDCLQKLNNCCSAECMELVAQKKVGVRTIAKKTQSCCSI